MAGVAVKRDGEDGRATEGAAERDGKDMEGEEGRAMEGALGVDERNAGCDGAEWKVGADGAEWNVGAEAPEDRNDGDDCEGLTTLGAERYAGVEAEGGCGRYDGDGSADAAVPGPGR